MTDVWLENKVFSEIEIGNTAHSLRQLTRRDIELFAVVSGDMNPTHIDEKYVKDMRGKGLVGHSIMGGALISAVLGTKLPGPGTIYLGQDLKFVRPVYPEDTLDVRVTVVGKEVAQNILVFDCLVTNQNGEQILTGSARVIAPTEKVRHRALNLPEVEVLHHDRMRSLVERAKALPSLRVGIVHPCDEVSLQGMAAAAEEGLIIPVLIGPAAKIRAAAEEFKIDLRDYEIVDVEHSHAAAIEAVSMARAGKVGALMKGSLHTDELMSAVVDRERGLRTDQRMSHVFVMDVPTYKWPLLITDAALNIAPDLMAKASITQNAIHVAQDLGVAQPKVAILAASESVNINMPATLDAAALCKMADRGQITGGVLDGPLAFDNAVNMEAAKIKKITSPVAGQADILVVPNIEAGNMVAKQLSYLAAAEAAGLVCGARVPIILTSRAEHAPARLASAALACMVAAGIKTRLDHKNAGKA